MSKVKRRTTVVGTNVSIGVFTGTRGEHDWRVKCNMLYIGVSLPLVKGISLNSLVVEAFDIC